MVRGELRSNSQKTSDQDKARKKSEKLYQESYNISQDRNKRKENQTFERYNEHTTGYISHRDRYSDREDRYHQESKLNSHGRGKKSAREIRYEIQAKRTSLARKEKMEKEEESQRINAEIKSHIESLQESGKIQNTKFNVLHFNILTKTDEVPVKYFPCEMGLVQFSLEQGLEKEFHSFLLPDKVPVSYSFQIKQDAEKTHQLDLHSTPILRLSQQCENDPVQHYSWILQSINQFIKQEDDETPPPLYTHPEDLEKTRYLINMMVQSTGLSQFNFQVFPLDQLFYRLCMNTPQGDKMSDSILSLHKLSTEMYLYTPNLSCSFHDCIDQPQFCSLMISKRWIFIICGECCPFYNIDLRVGRQFPVEVEKQVDRVDLYPNTEPGDQGGIDPGDQGWVPHLPVQEASRRSRYVDTDPTNDWGVVKSRGMPAGVMLNQTGEWNGPIRGKSEHVFTSDRKLLEQQLCRGQLNFQDHKKEISGTNTRLKENLFQGSTIQSSVLNSSPPSLTLTSPFARGRGMPQFLSNIHDTEFRNPVGRGRGFSGQDCDIRGVGRGFERLKM